MKLVRWNGDRTVTDSVIHYTWEPGTIYSLKNSVADQLLTNSGFSVVSKKEVVETPDAVLEEEALEYNDS